mgnify:CR=1 FL=1
MLWPHLMVSLMLLTGAPPPSVDAVTNRLVAAGELPKGVTVEESRIVHGRLVVTLEWKHPGKTLTTLQLDNILREYLGLPGQRGVLIGFKDEASPTKWRPLTDLLVDLPPVPKRPWETDSVAPFVPPPVVVPVDNPARGLGALAGKHVFVSQGHGWYWSSNLGRWATQRGHSSGTVEDFLNAESINQYLVQYLENAGATVHTLRERDMNADMVIVDNGDGGSHPENGLYEEFGEFGTSTAVGYSNFLFPLSPGENPMVSGDSRYSYVSTDSEAFARYTPAIPRTDFYAVYVSWSASPNRVTDAHYVVRHSGGETHFRVDQSHHGGSWNYLGTFYFEKGLSADAASVELRADSDEVGEEKVVSADAVRFGGGRGVVTRGNGSGIADSPTSLRPRWEECSRYAAQFNGAPESVYDASSADNSDDVSARSRFADWFNETGDDSVFVSWHTNAPSPATGTSTYVYGPNEPNGQYIFSGTAGSDKLAEFLHAEIVSDLQNGYDPTWKDRGIYTAWFGELNPSYNDEMPSVLVEVGFHDTESECLKLQEPAHRNVTARAFYQGIVRYFAWRDGESPRFLPEPPRQFRVQTWGGGTVRLTWAPPKTDDEDVLGDPATGYRVYHSLNGYGFDNGVDVGDVFNYDVEGLETDVPHFFRVTAYNEGGEGFSTPVLATRINSLSQRGVLVVEGFDRLDREMAPEENLTPFDLGTLKRFDLKRMNTYSYVVEHAWALHELDLPFDSAWHDSPVSPDTMATYVGVLWNTGEEASEDETFSDVELDRLRSYLAMGGRIVATGSEIGWDLVEKGDSYTRSAYAELFGAEYLRDNAETYFVSLGDGSQLTLDDGSHGTYDVDFPDVFLPRAGAVSVAWYDSDPESPGAVGWDDGKSGGGLMGFPLESVVSLEGRAAILKAVFDAAGVHAPAPGDEGAPTIPDTPYHPDLHLPEFVEWNPPDVVEDLSSQEVVEVISQDGLPVNPDIGTHEKKVNTGCRASTTESSTSEVLILMLLLVGALLIGKRKMFHFTQREENS